MKCVFQNSIRTILVHGEVDCYLNQKFERKCVKLKKDNNIKSSSTSLALYKLDSIVLFLVSNIDDKKLSHMV